MISIESNRELYLFDTVDRVRKSLDFAKSLTEPSIVDPVTFHFYWRVPKEFSRKQVLPIKSAIVSQKLTNTKFILWSNVDLKNNEHLKPLLPFVETRIWDISEQSKSSPLENANMLKGLIDDPLCYLGGDLFRLLCLHKHGGVYIDMDVVVLRDFSPILPYEFMYQWGASGTFENEPVIRQNGAIMRLKAYSQLCHDLLNELARTPAIPNTTCWGKDLYHKVRQYNKNWVVFPCAWFNTEWGLGNPPEAFKKNASGNDSSELYDGAFTWHWHNKWDEPIEDGSKFQILESMVDRKFKELIGE
jgi:hypothetical protein